MESSNQKTTATLMHLSTFAQFIIPLGNFIVPGIIWGTKKDNSALIDQEGKNILNFQMSVFMYQFIITTIGIIFLLRGIFIGNLDFNFTDQFQYVLRDHVNLTTGIIIFFICLLTICLLEFFKIILTIYAAVKTSDEKNYKYPISIKFFR